ncbi:DUF4159 domain-containing protein [Anatilimnocola sp. NA78]|uniref:DUF4159 domain-containing protein n=1 Tax=Anatilimnocola sp. NA78 TaxID=3415683 RepID=UPI003CE49242
MSRFRRCILLFVVTLVSTTALAIAQRSRWYRDIRPEDVDRNGVPEWKNDEQFKSDVFTFVRIRYESTGGRGRGGGGWATDYPDSDLNFSYRLHELTSLEVDPNGKILELTDDALFDYPFIYIIEPGRMWLREEEVVALRRYLNNGGFLMVDDFWGEDEYANLYENMKRVFPNREPVELPLEHEIFHCVYDLKKKPQVPSIHAWYNGLTTERYDAEEAHYRAIFDDEGRMMVIICHNTDLGDGWEREGMDPQYFKEMSEKYSYPMGINIVTYAMTH